MARRGLSLRLRLALLSGGVTLAALTALAVGSGLALERSRLAGLDGELKAQARAVLAAALEVTGGRLPPQIEQELTLETGRSSALVYQSGRLVWRGGRTDDPVPLDPAGRIGEPVRICSCGAWRVYSLGRGEVRVQIGRPLAPIRSTLADYAGAAILAGLLAALGAGVLTALVMGSATAPLARLARRVRRLESNEPIPALERRDELGALAWALEASLQELRQTREREARFLADASHELRTPVTAMIADLQHALSRPHPPAEPWLALERTLRGATHLRELASNLLALTRAGTGQPSRVRLDLLELASQAADRLMPLASAKGLEIVVTGEVAELLGDPVLLSRAIENLIGNAIKFTDVGLVRLEVAASAQFVKLTVTDTGAGIGPVQLERLWQPFHRADPAHRDGYGLGLAVVRGVVEAHGGTVGLSSTVGCGTVVSIELPTTPFEAQPRTAPSGLHPRDLG